MGNNDGLQFGRFRAMIKIGGKLAHCYAVDTNKRKKEVTCWIASELGQKFSVSLKKEETSYHCSPAIFLDGTKIVYRPLEKGFVGKRIYGSVVTSKATRRPFVFGELSITGNIGEIKITIHRGVHIVREKVRDESWNSEESDGTDSESDSDSDDESDRDSERNQSNSGMGVSKSHAEHIPSIRMVHESSSKTTMIPHQIKHGRPNVLERLRAEASNVSETPKKPTAVSFREIKECMVTFIFKYRPIEILQAHGVAPKHPPLPLPAGPVTLAPEAALPEIHGSPRAPPIPLLSMIDQERNNQLPSAANDPPNARIAAETALHSTPKLVTDDENTALSMLTGSKLYPHMGWSTTEEEKPTITSLKTAEEDDIDSKISMLLLHLETIRSKKRQIKEGKDAANKRVKAENMCRFLPGETIDLTLDSDA
ncbi:hypothetical protein HYPSUDRAFT_207269 [Hypholoma sublateritium FD-334 SS-4]|uniref:Uncharacterized protein n=1 Tax=Hypholoma sublateritium (strain FD-334 SS-4) TaxID=945553 RepID=A0A0D2LZB3_HYPSF|nr:hypothetical protein HYPSUDRAFT_207269 [Hypholoma sublateritium FD-334 SS-4]